ncbi:hypothetical protein [Lysinibacillus sp. SGAir0095]|uniref:hypothetical protein n=1 Tax=Lysinibacillus sp. SGAir0095 TaxID=2070463 RepID=UPI0010CD2060|nr:hypothetical protein [Lysinibacillus sp. SGAir0095]QCR31996.1 hypothetical protein C1N55_07340 [Lysinibacillus sp. SGAir0095]
MKLKYCIGLLVILSLSGCIGENYDFSPPSVELSSDSNFEPLELEEANIDWRGENNNQIENETEDILSLSKNLQSIYGFRGEEVDLLFGHHDFDLRELSVVAWKNEQKFELEASDSSFYLPSEKGDYILEVNLKTDRGTAQYVGNVNVQ